MQPAQPAQPAKPAQPDSSAAPTADSSSVLERKPTWARISFDDGFDLNLAATSSLARSPQNAVPPYPSAAQPHRLPTLAESHSIAINPAASASASASAPQSFFTTTSNPTNSNISDAVPAVHQQQSKRFSASPASSNKALPKLPPDTTSKATSDSRSVTALPASTSYASTIHAAATAPSSQDGTPTPKPPGTPQTYKHPSPVVTAATPEQPSRFDSDTTPVLRSTIQPTSRSSSVGILSSWDRAQINPPRPVSSADAYMHPIETLQSEASSRPGTAMSNLSGSNWIHEGPSNRSSFGTTSSAPLNQAKRASVLSFQTADSAGFTSADEARGSDRGDPADDTYLAAASAPANGIPVQPNRIRPWLDHTNSGYGSSPDERSFPGGLPGSFWDEPVPQPQPRAMPATRVQPESTPAPTSPAAAAPTTPTAKSMRKPVAAAVAEQVDARDVSADADAQSARVRQPVPSVIEPTLAPINTQNLAPSSPNAPLSSTTIAPPSDETTQAARLSPDIARSSAKDLEPIADVDVPLPPAKDVGNVEPAATLPAQPSLRDEVEAANAPDDKASSVPSSIPADNVIPPPLPSEAANTQPGLGQDVLINGPADQKPVSDYRKKPLADISPAQKAAGLAHLQAQAKVARQNSRDMPSNAPPTAPPPEAPPLAVMERGRRKSNASLTANVALAQAAAPGMARDDIVDRPDTPSAESGSRESSAPPDGEVEARAEWERRRIKRKNGNKKQSEAAKANKGRTDTFKSQLKPLQLVPADNIGGALDRNGMANSGPNALARGSGDRNSIAVGNRAANAITTGTSEPPAAGQTTTYSTQQLQRLQAREQRRSVGAFSAAMAAANVVSSGSNGPYPVFASPNSDPQKVGSRQYPGLMAQRSLVPPFELQHRPDGLPSGMIGPDGVRRSINDPEVCLECMMRDEDMIDIRVVGDGVWERESDKEFEEAVRLEAEEAASGQASHGVSGSSGHGDSISSHRDSRGSRKPRKRIGRGEPLTVERLKLHTQMNPPASSFRWRTLQTFLAIQAKYIAMEQQRMRLEAEKKSRYNNDSISSRGSFVASDSPVTAQQAAGAAGVLSSPFAPAREASAAPRQSILSNAVDDTGLTPLQKQEKERDVAAAQAARKKMTIGTPTAAPTPPMGMPAYPVTPLQTRALPQTIPARVGSEPDGLLSGVPAAGGSMTPNSGRRMPFASAQAARAVSVQDLRSAAEATRSASTAYPPSPDSLMPPSRSIMATSPTATPSRLAARSGASQLSLMHSGSMIDMHVGQEDRAEHRIKQNGFLPGTPLGVESPTAINRSYYGFPGDGDSSLPDPAAFERSRMVSGDGYVNPMEAGPRGLDLDRDDSTKRKKKGFRGLLSKLTGNSGGPSRENSGGGGGGGSVNGSIASRNASRRSQGSGSPKPRKNSLSADRSLDAATGAAQNGMLSRARRSTSTFFRNGAEPDVEPKPRAQPSAGNSLFQNPPGMASQSSLDLGPFQPASPQANAFGTANGRIADAARMRQASNPLMQKYLNSPSPQTQASPTSLTGFASTADGRMSSLSGMRDARSSGLQPIADGDTAVEESEARQSVRSSGGSASLRKELPAMPPPLTGAVAAEHQRTGPLAPSPAPGRGSMQASRSSGMPVGRLGAGPAGSGSGADGGYGTIPDDASIGSAGPRRPPRNPRRPDGALNSPSLVDLNASTDSGAVGYGRREFPQPGRYEPVAYVGAGSPESADKSKRSKFRLPFGRKKRDSTFGESKPSIVIGGGEGVDDGAAGTQMRSASGGFLPKLRSRKSYAGLGVPKASFQTERQRVLSSPAREAGGLPPRSQSAFGMAPTQRFMSMDIPRRSMNVGRTENRLSTVGYGAEDEDEEEEDDEMEREPGYEAEFNRYAQEALEEKHHASGRGREPSAGTQSFGRKSLNLLRDGFGLRQTSNGKR